MSKFQLQLGINHCTNSQYHGDKEYLSSTTLKKLLEDPKQFNDERLGLVEPKMWNKTAMEDGTLTHSMILEPESLDKEFYFWTGWTKRGKEFEAVVAKYPDKVIVSAPQKARVDGYVKAFKARKEAVQLLTGGFAELSICAILNGVKVKIRCDYINIDKGYIADVKTTAYPVEVEIFKNTVKELKYHLSGALYIMVAAEVFKKDFDFYFVAISKKDLVCEIFKLGTESKTQGKLMVIEALKLFKECTASGIWESRAKKPALDTDTDYEIVEV